VQCLVILYFRLCSANGSSVDLKSKRF
jgi:hypothetical protein